MVRDNIHLGDLRIELPGLALEDSCVDVRFTYDVNGLLQVEAKVLKTNRTFSLLIEGNPGVLSEEDIVERLAAMDALKIHPRDTIENRTTLARAERVYAQMRGNARQWLSEQILQFEASLATQDSRVANKARALLDEQLSHLERSAAVLADDAT